MRELNVQKLLVITSNISFQVKSQPSSLKPFISVFESSLRSENRNSKLLFIEYSLMIIYFVLFLTFQSCFIYKTEDCKQTILYHL